MIILKNPTMLYIILWSIIISLIGTQVEMQKNTIKLKISLIHLKHMEEKVKDIKSNLKQMKEEIEKEEKENKKI